VDSDVVCGFRYRMRKEGGFVYYPFYLLNVLVLNSSFELKVTL
jgi:hypothetical protein